MITLFCTLALQTVIEDVGPTLDGHHLVPSFAPTKLLLDRLRSGEKADVVILTKEGVLELVEEGLLGPGHRDVAISSIGLAQAVGVPTIDISTATKLREVLIGAKSVAYSASGASGIFFAELIKRLGIEATVKSKAVISPGGFTGEFVANGQAEIAIQQMSELHAVKGLGAIMPLPEEAQCLTVFSAASMASTTHDNALRAVVSQLTSESGRSRLQSVGLRPV
jgi:molybdate transport system substrate-binding protein